MRPCVLGAAAPKPPPGVAARPRTPAFLCVVLIIGGLVGGGGCEGSPPRRLYSLVPETGANQGGAAQALVEVLPVAVPEKVNRPEIVLENSGTAPLVVRDTERWAAPLPDEMRQLLADALWRTVQAADVYQAPVDPRLTPLPLYRLAMRVERFQAQAGLGATVEVSWTVRSLPDGAPVVCRRGLKIPISADTVEAAVAALGTGAVRLADAVAASVGRLARHQADPCGS